MTRLRDSQFTRRILRLVWGWIEDRKTECRVCRCCGGAVRPFDTVCRHCGAGFPVNISVSVIALFAIAAVLTLLLAVWLM